MSFEQSRVDQHVGYRNGRTARFRHQGTGLSVPGLINGREATEDEAAAQARAYQRSLDNVAEQLNIQPWRGQRA